MNLFIEQIDNFYAFCITQALSYEQIPYKIYFKNISLFDFVVKEKPDVVIITDTPNNVRDISFIKKEFPNIKFILLKIYNSKITETGNYFTIIDQQSLIRSCTFFYINAEKRKQYEANIIYINGNPNLDRSIINILNCIGHYTSLKIYGAKIPSPYYVGEPAIQEYKHILHSANGLLIYNNLEWTHNAIMNNCKPLNLNLDNPKETIDNIDAVFTLKNLSKAISYEELIKEIIEEIKKT